MNAPQPLWRVKLAHNMFVIVEAFGHLPVVLAALEQGLAEINSAGVQASDRIEIEIQVRS